MKTERKVVALSVILGPLYWTFDAVLDSLIHHEGTFWGLLITDVSTHEAYDRGIITVLFALFGVFISRALYRRKQAESELRNALVQAEQRQAEVSALLESSHAVLKRHQFQDAARSIFDSFKNLLGATAGYVALLSPDGTNNDVLFLDPGQLSCTVDPSLPMPIRGLRGEAYRTGKAVYHNNFFRSKWAKLMPEGHAKIENVLFAPLLIDGKAVGLIGLSNKPGGFTENDARLASAFGDLAAIALSNSRMLASLETSEKRFRSVVETASDAIISIDSNGNIIFWNHAAELIFGYSSDEMLGKPLNVIIPERFRESHEKALKRVVSSGKSKVIGKTVELAGLTKDGSEFPLELSLGAWKTAKDAFFTAIIRDITQRKQAEEALRESETKYRHLVENMQEGIWVIDENSYTTFVNPHMAHILGYTIDEMQGKHLFDFMDEHGIEICKHLLERRRQGIKEQIDFEFIRKDRKQVYASLETAPILDDEGNYVGAIACVMDITERKRVEETLQESEQRYRLIAENVTDVITSMDMNLKPTYISPSYTHLTGFTVEEAMTRTLENSLTPASREVAMKSLSQQLALQQDGEHHRSGFPGTELEFYRKDGSTVWVEVTVSFLRDAEGKPVGLVNVLRDISERKRAEEEKQRIEQQLQLAGRLAAVGELAAGVAHELNNPLAAVQAYAQFLTSRNDLDDSMRSDLEIIYKEALRASKITSNLLSFARSYKPEKSFISINETIEKCLELHEYRLKVNNIEVISELDADLPMTLADDHQMQQVFINLITNAEQAMTEAHSKGKLSVKTQRVGEMIQATFIDDGPGIPEDDLKRIFDPFFTTKDVGKGTGLGLSICYGIIQEHGGHLYARSESSKGTVFVVELPIVSDEQIVVERSDLVQMQGSKNE